MGDIHNLHQKEDKLKEVLKTFEQLSEIIKISLEEGGASSLTVMFSSELLDSEAVLCFSGSIPDAVEQAEQLNRLSATILEQVLGELDDIRNENFNPEGSRPH